MQPHGVLFPGEHVQLDVYIASALRLFATIQTNGLCSSLHPDPPSWQQLPTRLLTRAFAVAPSRTSPFGAIAVFDDDDLSPFCTTTHFNHFTRFRARVVARYALAAPVHVHAPYPCVQVRLLCEAPPPPLSIPLREAFPLTAPATPELRSRASQTVLTRAAAAAATVRKRKPRRSSAFMAGLSFDHWTACTPGPLARKARAAAMYARLDIDICLLEHCPADGDCPSLWSFWLCAALPADTSPDVLLDLLGECSVIVRLKKLIELFENLPRLGKKRARQKVTQDRTYRCKSSPKKVRKTYNTTEERDLSPSPSPIAKPLTKRLSTVRSVLTEELKDNPWPSSPAKGFQQVNLSTPVKGRFQPLRIFLDDTLDTKKKVIEPEADSGTPN